ncbi:dTDP-4-amino-4,6-dideoxygalactose transaminase [Kineosphaera limosa]|uniref:Putative aminotransferase n=1 Tax=Kineosphaera limosa NBRC 100340 TaxID=1184609 RepID=K6VLK1_9MICO|nr:dTDP-4-amino-4,6-dideoxygalactose transaminase [Kineosphaera limosa]GAB97098.1 putative aminotransferase [Kineosphaera limosa NBRC 100340]
MPELACDAVPFAPPDIGEEEIEAVTETLRSGWLTTGPNAAAFESEFAAALRSDFASCTGSGTAADEAGRQPKAGELHAVALNSATAGLHLAVEALGIGPGDEVIVPTWTFTATAEVVRYVGAEPVFVDVDPHTLNLDLAAARAAITCRTAAVIPVHFAGLPVDRAGLAALAAEHDLTVIEDAAHAFPVRSSGVPVGVGSSDAVVFSFYATKTMTTGEGGMLVTPSAQVAARARTMRLHGISRDIFGRYSASALEAPVDAPSWFYEVVAPGFKYNLTDPAAAMGRVQLRRAVAMRQARARIAARYHEAFADLPLRLPAGDPGRSGEPDGEHAWHLYVVRLTDAAPLDRDAFVRALTSARVGTSLHFIPLHRQPYWQANFVPPGAAFPVADDAYRRAVSLPIFSAMTPDQVERVVHVVREALGGS